MFLLDRDSAAAILRQYLFPNKQALKQWNVLHAVSEHYSKEESLLSTGELCRGHKPPDIVVVIALGICGGIYNLVSAQCSAQHNHFLVVTLLIIHDALFCPYSALWHIDDSKLLEKRRFSLDSLIAWHCLSQAELG